MESLYAKLNSECCNREKSDFVLWKDGDIVIDTDQTMQLVRDYCYEYTYYVGTPDEIHVKKTCDHCFVNLFEYRYQLQTANQITKDQEIQDLKNRIDQLETIVNTLTKP